MAARSTAFAAFCAQLNLCGAEVGRESRGMALFRLLGNAGGAGPALGSEFLDCFSVRAKVNDSEPF